MDQKLKILVFSHSHETGGAELALLDMLDFFNKKKPGVEPHFILPKKGILQGQLEKRGWSYTIFPYSNWLWEQVPMQSEDVYRERMKNILAAHKAQELIQELKPDIVLSNTLVCPWGALAAGMEGVPHVWYIHEYGDEDHGHTFEMGRAKTLRDIGFLSDLVIANSLAIRKRLIEFMPADKVKTTYIPYDVESVKTQANKPLKSYFIDDPSLKIVFTGRIIPSKGQLTAVEAVALLKKEGINVQLCLIGLVQDVSYNDQILILIKKHSLKRQVILAGHVDNPYPIIKAADIGIIASRNEAFGRITFEYLLLGKPVIGTNSGGTTDMVINGKDGFLYTPGSAEELARHIKIYINKPELIKQHGDVARQTAELMLVGEHSAGVLLNRLLELGKNNKKDPKLPNIVGEMFHFPKVITAYHQKVIADPHRSLIIRALKAVYHRSPRQVRRIAKPYIKKLKELRKRHG